MVGKTLAQRYVEAIEAGNVGLRVRLETELDDETNRENARLDAPGALRGAALFYASRGVAVFPCVAGGKQPATAKGFKDATTDRDQIGAWWLYQPNANIGAPTGITFDVIDIDGPEGLGSVYSPEKPLKLPAEIGHSLTTRMAGHHIFIEPTGRGNRASFLPGVDYRGAGGYVILPPSRGANGRRYAWTKPLEVLR